MVMTEAVRELLDKAVQSIRAAELLQKEGFLCRPSVKKMRDRSLMKAVSYSQLLSVTWMMRGIPRLKQTRCRNRQFPADSKGSPTGPLPESFITGANWARSLARKKSRTKVMCVRMAL